MLTILITGLNKTHSRTIYLELTLVDSFGSSNWKRDPLAQSIPDHTNAPVIFTQYHLMPLTSTLCDKVCQWLVASRWYSPYNMGGFTNKTDRTDINKMYTTDQNLSHWNDKNNDLIFKNPHRNYMSCRIGDNIYIWG
jgi:hypothetical protein